MSNIGAKSDLIGNLKNLKKLDNLNLYLLY